MLPLDELARLDAGWDAPEPTPDFASHGTFGHASERRLGLRVPSRSWALLSDGKQGAYARALELSTTGAVLKLLGDRGSLALAGAAPLTMLLFLPEAAPHVAALARRVRKIGELDAFEFVEMPAAERLTLAEHLDRLVFGRAGVELLRRSRRLGTRPTRTPHPSSRGTT
jgi:hypothetical protein